jgi:type IV fimbrial biogenesis protein FimT
MFNRILRARGHTLPELMVMFGIVAIIAGAAAPAFSNLLLDSRMNAAVMTAMHAVNLARQFSATRGEAIQLCGSDDEQDCTGRADWSTGLLLADGREYFRRSLPMSRGNGVPQVRSNRAIVNFEGDSGFASPATITVCDRRGSQAARAVIISRSGRPRVSARDASDRPIAC